MELTVIVAGMAIGGLIGYTAANVPHDTSAGAAAICSLIGSILGAASAYGFLFLMRQGVESAKLPPPKREFTPQIVGSPCSTCQEKIVFVGDGSYCMHCNRIYCKTCEAAVPCSRCVRPIVAEIVE